MDSKSAHDVTPDTSPDDDVSPGARIPAARTLPHTPPFSPSQQRPQQRPQKTPDPIIQRVESVIDLYSRGGILKADQRSEFELSPTWTILSAVCKTRSLLCGLFERRVSLGVGSRASCEGPRLASVLRERWNILEEGTLDSSAVVTMSGCYCDTCSPQLGMVNSILGDLKRVASLLEPTAQHIKKCPMVRPNSLKCHLITVVKQASYVTNKTNTIPCTRLGHLCHARCVGFGHQVHRRLQS
jgi:hypothetical protein